jgi:Flp pilus assembly pilin Flp
MSTLGTFSAQLRALHLRATEERAQTMAEYAVILTAITIAIFLALALLGTSLGTHITNVANLVGP